MIGIFTAGHNCAKFAGECIRSVQAQTSKEWCQVVVDDASADSTYQELMRASDGHARIRVMRNDTRRHSNVSILRSIRALIEVFDLKSTDILMCLDLDDMLDPGAVERVAAEHEAGAWVTYGNWKDQTGNINEHVPCSIDAFGSIRTVKWFMTHALSFRVGVFEAIPEKFFKWSDSNKYYETAFDASAMYPAVDLAGGDRVHGIPEPIYVYRKSHSGSVLQTWPPEHRTSIFADQRSKPRLERMEAL